MIGNKKSFHRQPEFVLMLLGEILNLFTGKYLLIIAKINPKLTTVYPLKYIIRHLHISHNEFVDFLHSVLV